MTNAEKIEDFVLNKFDPTLPLSPAWYVLFQTIKQDEDILSECSSLDKGYQHVVDEEDEEDELSLLPVGENEFDSIEDENEVNMTERSYELKSIYGEVDEVR